MTFDADQMPPEYDDYTDDYEDDAPSDDVPFNDEPEGVPPARRLPNPPPPHQFSDSGRIKPQVPVTPQFAGDYDMPQRSWLLDLLGIEDPIVLGLLVLAIPLIILGLLLPPFTVIDILDDQINPDPAPDDAAVISTLLVPGPRMRFQPVNSTDPGLTIGALTLTPSSGVVPPDYQVSGVSMTPENYMSGLNPGAGWHCATYLPRELQLASEVYSLSQRGTPPESITLTLNATPELVTDPAVLELRTWNDDGAQWETTTAIPAEDGTFVLDLPTLPRCVTVVQRVSDLPTTFGVTVRPGDIYAPELLPQGTRIFAGTLRPTPDGAIQVVRGPAFDLRPGSSIIVLAQNFSDPAVLDVNTLNTILADPAQRSAHAQTLAAFITANPDYVGLALDYRAIDPAQRDAYTLFVTELARLLHWNRRTLTVILPVPGDLLDQTTWGAGAYDWPAVSHVADEIIVTLPPSGKPFGTDQELTPTEAVIAWAKTVVDPLKLTISLDALSVDEQMASGQVAPITFQAALDDLGKIQLLPATTLEPLQPVTAELTSPAGLTAEFGRDSSADVPYVVYRVNGQLLRTIWLTDAQTLITRLAQIDQLGVGGMVVTNLMAAGTVQGAENALLRYGQGGTDTSTALQFEIAWSARQGDQVIAQQVLPTGNVFGFTTIPRGNNLTVEARFNGMVVASESAAVVGTSSVPVDTTTVAALAKFGVGLHLANPATPSPALDGLTGDWVATDIVFRSGAQARSYQAALDAAHALNPTAKVYVRLRIDVADILSLSDKSTYQREYALFAAALTRFGADAIEIYPAETNLWSPLDHAVHMATASYFIKTINPQTLVVAGLHIQNNADYDFFVQANQYTITRFMDCAGIEVRADATFDTPEATLAARVLQIHDLLGREFPVCPTISYWAAQDDTSPAQGAWLSNGIAWSRVEQWVPLVLVWTADTSGLAPDDLATGYALVRPDGACPACEALRAVFSAE